MPSKVQFPSVTSAQVPDQFKKVNDILSELHALGENGDIPVKAIDKALVDVKDPGVRAAISTIRDRFVESTEDVQGRISDSQYSALVERTLPEVREKVIHFVEAGEDKETLEPSQVPQIAELEDGTLAGKIASNFLAGEIAPYLDGLAEDKQARENFKRFEKWNEEEASAYVVPEAHEATVWFLRVAAFKSPKTQEWRSGKSPLDPNSSMGGGVSKLYRAWDAVQPKHFRSHRAQRPLSVQDMEKLVGSNLRDYVTAARVEISKHLQGSYESWLGDDEQPTS
jgi:hypothetical protein